MSFILKWYSYLYTEYTYLKEEQGKEPPNKFLVNALVILFVVFFILTVRWIVS